MDTGCVVWECGEEEKTDLFWVCKNKHSMHEGCIEKLLQNSKVPRCPLCQDEYLYRMRKILVGNPYDVANDAWLEQQQQMDDSPTFEILFGQGPMTGGAGGAPIFTDTDSMTGSVWGDALVSALLETAALAGGRGMPDQRPIRGAVHNHAPLFTLNPTRQQQQQAGGNAEIQENQTVPVRWEL